jgi:hypothetical protein
MPITRVGVGTPGTTSADLSGLTILAGDLIIVCAYRDGSTTSPTAPAEYPIENAIRIGGNNNNSNNVRYKIAVGGETSTDTWTNATAVVAVVYRDAAIGASAQNGDTVASVTYPALTLQNGSGTSWVVGFAGHRSVDTALETPPTGWGNRSSFVDATCEAAIHDTGAGVASWAGEAVSVGGTAAGWRAVTVEMLPLRDNRAFFAAEAVPIGWWGASSTPAIGWFGPEFIEQPPASSAIAGAAAIALASATAAATGVLPIAGTAAPTLGAATLASAGALRIAGAASVTLGAATLAATGVLPIASAAGVTLGAATLVATGALPIAGAAAPTLAAATLAAAGVLPLAGTASVTLGATTLAAAGALRIAGTASVTLAPATLAAAGIGGGLTGSLAVTLGAATLAAAGVVGGGLTGSLAVTLSPATLVAAGRVRITGSAAINLGQPIQSMTYDGIPIKRLWFGRTLIWRRG